MWASTSPSDSSLAACCFHSSKPTSRPTLTPASWPAWMALANHEVTIISSTAESLRLNSDSGPKTFKNVSAHFTASVPRRASRSPSDSSSSNSTRSSGTDVWRLTRSLYSASVMPSSGSSPSKSGTHGSTTHPRRTECAVLNVPSAQTCSTRRAAVRARPRSHTVAGVWQWTCLAVGLRQHLGERATPLQRRVLVREHETPRLSVCPPVHLPVLPEGRPPHTELVPLVRGKRQGCVVFWCVAPHRLAVLGIAHVGQAGLRFAVRLALQRTAARLAALGSIAVRST